MKALTLPATQRREKLAKSLLTVAFSEKACLWACIAGCVAMTLFNAVGAYGAVGLSCAAMFPWLGAGFAHLQKKGGAS